MAAEKVLDASGVCAQLGGAPVLRDVDLALRQGEFVALVGGNGSGKSTLVRTVLGLTELTRGSVQWFGTPLRAFEDWQRIGYVPQRSMGSLANATVTEVVGSGLLSSRKLFHRLSGASRAQITATIDRVGLAERANWPLGKLSGGQQQRTLIARALVANPEVLVLDEPMAGIDLNTQHQLAELLATLKGAGCALLVVLHEQGALAELIDTTVALRDGRVVSAAQLDHHHDDGPAASTTVGLHDPIAEAH